ARLRRRGRGEHGRGLAPARGRRPARARDRRAADHGDARQGARRAVARRDRARRLRRRDHPHITSSGPISFRAMPRFSVLAGVLAWLILAPAATAAVRVADPGGAGTACTDAAPCAIDTAINSAGDNDEVILNAGDYGTVAAPLTTGLTGFGANLAIHGRAGAARPSIVSSSVFALQFGGTGATLRDVSLRSVYADNGDALIISGSALAERVEV